MGHGIETWHVALALTFVIGVAVLVFGAVHDRRRNAARDAAAARPPRIPGRPDPGGPVYVSAREARRPVERPADPGRDARLESALPAAVALPLPLLSGAFVTDRTRGRAVLEGPDVLVTDASLSDPRRLLGALERSVRSGRPLVVVAAEITGAARSTCEVNVLQARLDLLALEADADARTRVVELSGASPLDAADLAAGYLPPEALGGVAWWVSDADGSRVVPAQS